MYISTSRFSAIRKGRAEGAHALTATPNRLCCDRTSAEIFAKICLCTHVGKGGGNCCTAAPQQW